MVNLSELRTPGTQLHGLAHSLAFNIELQLDFAFETGHGTKRTIFLSTDPGSKLTEEAITASKVVETMCPMLEHYWVLRHGAPVALSADDKYNRKELRAFSHFTQLHLTPPRSKKKQDTNN